MPGVHIAVCFDNIIQWIAPINDSFEFVHLQQIREQAYIVMSILGIAAINGNATTVCFGFRHGRRFTEGNEGNGEFG